jgi:hypothetical protein
VDDPDDFYNKHVGAHMLALFAVGDLVCFIGYQYSPDYIYIDADDYHLGVIIAVNTRGYYQTIYAVHWFKKNRTTEVVEEHLSLVDRQFKDYL